MGNFQYACEILYHDTSIGKSVESVIINFNDCDIMMIANFQLLKKLIIPISFLSFPLFKKDHISYELPIFICIVTFALYLFERL
jgi:hypothetical protein